jgi:virulence factor
MLKIGITGLGDIAKKAYLPLITRKKVELHLYTRDQQSLREIGAQYRITQLHTDLSSLVSEGIHGVFIHSSTPAHFETARFFLAHNVHVFVDKPVCADYPSTETLFQLARGKGLCLFAGFNRRHAPCYAALRGVSGRNMIVMQKNRRGLPGEIRTFVFDDFIHVVDTLLFLLPANVRDMRVTGKKRDGMLFHIILEFTDTEGNTALGIMNRDGGTVEERLEVFSGHEKHVVNNLSDHRIYRDGVEIVQPSSDWEYTLHKRGFDQMIDAFLLAVQEADTHPQHHDPLLTHYWCEEIVKALSS